MLATWGDGLGYPFVLLKIGVSNTSGVDLVWLYGIREGYLGRGCARKHEGNELRLRESASRVSPIATDGDHRNWIQAFRSSSVLATNLS